MIDIRRVDIYECECVARQDALSATAYLWHLSMLMQRCVDALRGMRGVLCLMWHLSMPRQRRVVALQAKLEIGISRLAISLRGNITNCLPSASIR